MGRRSELKLKAELCTLRAPEFRRAHVDETAALCLAAYRSRRRMRRLSVPELTASQLRFVARPIWAAQAVVVLCMCLALHFAMRSGDFAADVPALLSMSSVFMAMSVLPFYGRSRKYKMRELESSTRLSCRRLTLAKLCSVGVGDTAGLIALSMASAGGFSLAANMVLGFVVLPFLLACTGILLILEHSREGHGVYVSLGFGFGLAAVCWMLPAELGRLMSSVGVGRAAAICAALLTVLILECRRLLRQMPSRNLQEALSC